MIEQIQFILSAILATANPGGSHYSRVMLDHCDSTCQETRVCETPGNLCDPPKFEKWKFQELVTSGLNEEKAKLKSFSRPETEVEAFYRFKTVATSTYQTVNAVSYVNLPKKDKEYCKNNHKTEKCQRLRKERFWKGDPRHLANSLLTVMKFESGFRRDIHSGVGSLSRGDCITRGGVRICQSVCLGQIKLRVMRNGERKKTQQGWEAEELVGLDLSSTNRCLYSSAKVLSRSHNYCSSSNREKHTPSEGGWIADMFSVYGTGHSCKAYIYNKKTKTKVLYTHPQKRARAWQAFNRDSRNNNHLVKFAKTQSKQFQQELCKDGVKELCGDVSTALILK